MGYARTSRILFLDRLQFRKRLTVPRTTLSWDSLSATLEVLGTVAGYC